MECQNVVVVDIDKIELEKHPAEYKKILRQLFDKQYRHELLNNLFFHPYTKIEFMEKDMMVSRQTASKYLNTMVEAGLLERTRIGKTNYYINIKLVNLFLNMNA